MSSSSASVNTFRLSPPELAPACGCASLGHLRWLQYDGSKMPVAGRRRLGRPHVRSRGLAPSPSGVWARRARVKRLRCRAPSRRAIRCVPPAPAQVRRGSPARARLTESTRDDRIARGGVSSEDSTRSGTMPRFTPDTHPQGDTAMSTRRRRPADTDFATGRDHPAAADSRTALFLLHDHTPRREVRLPEAQRSRSSSWMRCWLSIRRSGAGHHRRGSMLVAGRTRRPVAPGPTSTGAQRADRFYSTISPAKSRVLPAIWSTSTTASSCDPRSDRQRDGARGVVQWLAWMFKA